MFRALTKLLLFVLVFLQTNEVFSQTVRDTTSALIDQLYQSWKENYTRYTYDHMSGEKTTVDDIFYGELNDSIRVRNFIEELKQAEANILKREYGIDWRSGYMHNLSPGESDFDNIIYRSRFTSEIGWNILRSGYVHNQIRAQIASNEGKIAAIEQQELNKSAAFALRWNQVIYLFNLEKIKLLDQRLKLAQQKIDVVKQLYFLN